jgi:uncharacterized protein (DUF1015 family)
MADVRPFSGLRFDPRRVDVSATVCPPFDVISPAAQQGYHARDPHNVVRVELGLGPADPLAPNNRYEAAATALRDWQRAGVLFREPAPALYLHEQRFEVGGRGFTRRGLIVAGRLHDWSEGQVLPHEGTRSGPKQDRLALLRATHTNVSPLWLLYDDSDRAVSQAVRQAWSDEPVAAASTEGEQHTLRAISDPAIIRSVVQAFATRPLYIADGHHRYETAQIYRDQQRAAPGNAGGRKEPDAGYEFAMMLVTALDDPGVVVLPTHRLVRRLDQTAPEVRAALEQWLVLTPLDLPTGDDVMVGAAMEEALARAGQSHGHAFGLLESDGAWLLTPRSDVSWQDLLPKGHSEAWQQLDVSVLDAIAIRHVCGIHAEGEASQSDATSHAPSDRLAYVSDFAGAVTAVRSGEAQQAFFLNPTRVDQVCAVAGAGDRMPPKSTYFYPKPVTGLVLHPLDGTRLIP